MVRHPVHGFERVENKKDKFPNYLHHVSPEDDPLATRTLFAGNLEINITEEELRRIFSKYGIVDDIDIKRPPPGTGNAYAFVRFQTLDMAHRCKVELSGQYIGKFQCKIGYGKATPTTRIWVGGLGPWTSVAQLEREFDRFGAIKKIDYIKSDTNAYILYDSIDAAQAAVKEMRGFPLGGPDRRLRVDFADVTPSFFGFKPRPYPEDGADFDPYGAENDFNYSSSRSFRGATRKREKKMPDRTASTMKTRPVKKPPKAVFRLSEVTEAVSMARRTVPMTLLSSGFTTGCRTSMSDFPPASLERTWVSLPEKERVFSSVLNPAKRFPCLL